MKVLPNIILSVTLLSDWILAERVASCCITVLST